MILGPATITLIDASNVAILAQAIVSPSAVGELYHATCDLIVAPIVPTGRTQFGDLTIPAWGGYAAQTITWNAPTSQTVGDTEMDGASVSFTLPSGAVSQTIYGWAVSDTSPRLAVVGVLVTPILINVPDVAVVVPAFAWVAPTIEPIVN